MARPVPLRCDGGLHGACGLAHRPRKLWEAERSVQDTRRRSSREVALSCWRASERTRSSPRSTTRPASRPGSSATAPPTSSTPPPRATARARSRRPRWTAAASSPWASTPYCPRLMRSPESRSGARPSSATSTPRRRTSASRCLRWSIRGNVIVHVGGNKSGALMALDGATGTIKWQWKGEGPAYASPVLATFGTSRQVITQSRTHMVGISAADGRLLWNMPFTTAYDQNIVTPIVSGDLVVYSGIDQPRRRFGCASRVASGRRNRPGAPARCRCT